MPTAVIYNSLMSDIASGNVTLGSHAFKAMLVTSSYSPDSDVHTKRSNITNEIIGTGYSSGGVAVTLSVNAVNNTDDVLDVTIGSFSISSLTASDIARMVIYRTRGGASSADELVLCNTFDAPLSSAGGTLNVTGLTLRMTNLLPATGVVGGETADGVPATPTSFTITDLGNGSIRLSFTDPGQPWTKANFFRKDLLAGDDSTNVFVGSANYPTTYLLLTGPSSGWYSAGLQNTNSTNTWFGNKNTAVQYTASGTGGGSGGGTTLLNSDSRLILRLDATLDLPAIGTLAVPDQSPVILMAGTTGTDPAGAGPNDPPVSSVQNVVYDIGSGIPTNTYIHIASNMPDAEGRGKEQIHEVGNGSTITRTNTPGDAASRCHRTMLDTNGLIRCEYDTAYVFAWTMRFPSNIVALPNNWMQLGMVHNYNISGPSGRQPMALYAVPGGYVIDTCWGPTTSDTQDHEFNTAAFSDTSVTPNVEHAIIMYVKFSTSSGGYMTFKRRVGRTGTVTQVATRTGITVRSGDSETAVYCRIGLYSWALQQINPNRFTMRTKGLFIWDATTTTGLTDANILAYLDSK